MARTSPKSVLEQVEYLHAQAIEERDHMDQVLAEMERELIDMRNRRDTTNRLVLGLSDMLEGEALT